MKLTEKRVRDAKPEDATRIIRDDEVAGSTGAFGRRSGGFASPTRRRTTSGRSAVSPLVV